MPESTVHSTAREFLNEKPNLMPKAVAAYGATIFPEKADKDEFLRHYFHLKHGRAQFASDGDRWKN